MSLYRDKQDFRKRLISLRESMSDSDYLSSSISICRNLSSLELIAGARTIHSFWPILPRREPDIRSLIIELFRKDVRIVLPVVTAFRSHRSDRPRLRHIEFSGVDQLRKNRWGIDEPMGGVGVAADEIDVVVAPALGVDSIGNRLGHGYGYYDEFLAGLNIPVICPIFGDFVVDALPHDENDVPISVIITENAIIDLTRT